MQANAIVILTKQPSAPHIQSLCTFLTHHATPFELIPSFQLPSHPHRDKCFVVVDNSTGKVELETDQHSAQFLFVGYPKVRKHQAILFTDQPQTILQYYRAYSNLPQSSIRQAIHDSKILPNASAQSQILANSLPKRSHQNLNSCLRNPGMSKIRPLESKCQENSSNDLNPKSNLSRASPPIPKPAKQPSNAHLASNVSLTLVPNTEKTIPNSSNLETKSNGNHPESASETSSKHDLKTQNPSEFQLPKVESKVGQPIPRRANSHLEFPRAYPAKKSLSGRRLVVRSIEKLPQDAPAQKPMQAVIVVEDPSNLPYMSYLGDFQTKFGPNCSMKVKDLCALEDELDRREEEEERREKQVRMKRKAEGSKSGLSSILSFFDRGGTPKGNDKPESQSMNGENKLGVPNVPQHNKTSSESRSSQEWEPSAHYAVVSYEMLAQAKEIQGCEFIVLCFGAVPVRMGQIQETLHSEIFAVIYDRVEADSFFHALTGTPQADFRRRMKTAIAPRIVESRIIRQDPSSVPRAGQSEEDASKDTALILASITKREKWWADGEEDASYDETLRMKEARTGEAYERYGYATNTGDHFHSQERILSPGGRERVRLTVVSREATRTKLP